MQDGINTVLCTGSFTLTRLSWHELSNSSTEKCRSALNLFINVLQICNSQSKQKHHHARFRKTLLSTGGASTLAVAIFFPAARTPTLRFFFLLATVVTAVFDFPPFFMIVVPVEVVVALLLLLTDRLSIGTFNINIPCFGIVAAGLVADGLVAFRPVLAFARVCLTLSLVMLVKFATAVIAVAFAGEADLSGGIGFSGETGREM